VTVDFLAHTNAGSRVIAQRLAAAPGKTTRELRRMIPVEAILQVQIKAAFTGLLQSYDENGNEIGPAIPVDQKTRFELLKELRRIRLPDAKVEEDAGRDFDPTTLPATLREAESLTPKELDEAIAASFTLAQEETNQCPPTSSTASQNPAPPPKATGGSSSQSPADGTPSP
jgi:hypothetical protein